MKPLVLGVGSLKIEDVRDVALFGRKVSLAKKAESKINEARKFLLATAKDSKTTYGVNTGFGSLSSVRIPDKDLEQLQYNFLRSHSTGIGAKLKEHYVRAMLLLRAQSLVLGHSGVSVDLINALLDLLNKNVHPIVPEQGSVGASGDLAPLAHLALVLIGEGKAVYNGKEMSGAQAMKAAGIPTRSLGPKDGLALTNGTQFMTALGTLSLLEGEYLCRVADHIGAMTLEALRGTAVAFDPRIHQLRPHPGQVETAKVLTKLLRTGGRSEIAKSHLNCDRVQDPYSLRCMPQVHGASKDTIRNVRAVLETEINSVTDNPLIFAKDKVILSGGNFHGQYVAMAMDHLAIAVAELASISEQRFSKLVNPAMSGLPAFLINESGLNSGLMITHYAAASIVSENKTLCHPAVVDTIPTSADKEDHVSMGAWGAVKAKRVVANSRRVLAMEALAASQGIDLLRPLKTTPPLEKVHALIRKHVPKITQDRIFHNDIEVLERLIEDEKLLPSS